MSKKIAILLALAIYCCLHSLANGHEKNNREESVNKGRQPWPPLGPWPPLEPWPPGPQPRPPYPQRESYVWWDCVSEEGFLGQVCLPQNTRRDSALNSCKGTWPQAWQSSRTSVPCSPWRANWFWPFLFGLKKTLSCNVCLPLSLGSVCTQTACNYFFVRWILFSSLYHFARSKK